MILEFDGVVWEWRGPAPYHFVSVPEDECVELAEAAALVSYGWGMIPVRVAVGETELTTSLWPKDGGYVVPLKDKLRRAEGVSLGDEVTVRLTVDVRPR
ncbi:DUF1905 domain-containing protein [Nocardioides lianchengensis]|uniref:DUF1905 domain-containing protein n=1 Tax=Nocardioides lianchengensis TaxID=1045774 RepID=A0A1G6PT73_9ACTN|nr:DUF1905 domain-containing protein [Nocardioides lianchengensis]NYG11958.1 hypothetical protein [Nocardioides lianchengensis]SDC82854.1 protein of unknown function [Nocardioides lianchengensis]